MKNQGKRMVGAGAVAVVFLSLYGALSGVGQMERQAILSKVRGPVEFRLQGGDWQKAEPQMILHEKDEIRTAKGGFVEILLDQEGGSGRLELNEKSHLRLSTLAGHPASEEKSTFLDLAIGRVLVHAEKLKRDSKFEIRTPTATTGVRGTVFEVSVEEK